MTTRILRFAASCALVVGFLLGWSTYGASQSSASGVLAAPEVRASEVLERGGYAVVIDLDENELHFLRGHDILWTAPVGTGMGLRLEASDRRWSFTTPTGTYQVQAKEENPTWYAPDWYFLENNLPVPPRNDAARRFPGGLGAAAVYIGRGLAIHGTDKPDLLGQRVSHGCIRLANEYAERLYHNVQVGTKVLIVGSEQEVVGDLIPGRVPGTGPVDARTERLRQRAKADRDRLLRDLSRASHDTLDERLKDGLRGDEDAKWPAVAGELIRRVLKDDDLEAARVLVQNVEEAPRGAVRAEYATFVADLAARRGVLTTRALAALPERNRVRAAEVIASATFGLFSDASGNQVVPWPTRRILDRMIDDESRPGWEALARAERTARDRYLPAAGTR